MAKPIVANPKQKYIGDKPKKKYERQNNLLLTVVKPKMKMSAKN